MFIKDEYDKKLIYYLFHAFNQLVTSWQTKIPWFARNVSEFRMLVPGQGESVIHVIHVSFLRWVYRIKVSVIRLSKSDVAWVDTNEWPGSCLSHHPSHHTKPNVSLSNVSSFCLCLIDTMLKRIIISISPHQTNTLLHSFVHLLFLYTSVYIGAKLSLWF